MVFKTIDYKRISDYYKSIILYILNNLSYACAVEYNNDSEYIRTDYSKEEYEEEYLNAYSCLERATWRLSELDEMTDFYNEENFFYFGMNNLSSARHRIEHYLENTSWNIFNDLDYHKYDDLVIDFYQPIRLGELGYEASEKWRYYWDLHGTAQMKQYLIEDCNEIIGKLNNFVDYLGHADYSVLKENIQFLESLNDSTLDFLFSIPIVPFKNNNGDD